MARRPSFLGPARRFGYVKLPGKSKRWRNEVTGETISDRKMSDIAREARLGEKTTKVR